MKTLIYLTLTALSLFIVEARACDGPWRYLGHPPWDIVSATVDPDDRTQILAGTYARWDVPGSGGVWTCTDTDTLWHYAGLAGRRVLKISYYPYCRPNVFASTDNGLYVRLQDTTWSWIGGGGAPWEQWDFTISPYDTSVWMVTLYNIDFSRGILISHDSGQSWSNYYLMDAVLMNNMLWSRTLPNVFYFGGDGVTQGNVTDSTFRTVLPFSWRFPNTIALHSEQPWIYACGNHRVGRYDEFTGDTLTSALPPEVEDVENIVYTESGLMVNTSRGFYRVSDDFRVWQADTVNSIAATLLFTSADRCLAVAANGLYASRNPDDAPAPHAAPRARALTVYPNPSNGGFIIMMDRTEELRIYDLLGCEVYSHSLTGPGLVRLEVPNLSSGTYFLRTINGDGRRDNTPAVKITLVK